MRRWWFLPVMLVGGLIAILGGTLALGGPSAPQPKTQLLERFSAVDDRDLPDLRRYRARDGTRLAYRRYSPGSESGRGSVVLIHGSAGTSRSMHRLARALAGAGWHVFTLEMRGHGASGPRGRVDYIGQLDHDLADFVAATTLPGPRRVLVGFSAGGGFVVRVAASDVGQSFDRFVLLAPFLHPKAPTTRSGGGGWVDVGLPRLLVLNVLNEIGVRALNHLPILAFALDETAPPGIARQYGYALATNFRAHAAYRADIRRAAGALRVLVGDEDTIVRPAKFDEVFGEAATVRRIRGVDHIGLILDDKGIGAVRRALRR